MQGIRRYWTGICATNQRRPVLPKPKPKPLPVNPEWPTVYKMKKVQR